jgi:2-methylisocitrate lyase-like PEP mutase family enzyme
MYQEAKLGCYMRPTTELKQLVEAPEVLLMPGVHDALSAKIAETTGFSALMIGGYSATACLLGQPDTSQLSLTELRDHCARICESVDIPVMGDADTGFGNVTNVARSVRLLERSGLAGLFIEDQVFPKRCGHMAGKQVAPTEEMLAKLKAALDARQDPDFIIMARTDAIATHGIDEALERMALYREVGADMLFVEAPRDIEQMRRICSELDGPCLANMVEAGNTPLLSAAELQEIGYAAGVFPVAATYAVAHALTGLMQSLYEHGTTEQYREHMLDFSGFNRLVGLPELRSNEQSYLEFARQVMKKDG